MQRKLQKEEHNRQDKKYKPDYIENLALPGVPNPSSTTLSSLNLRFTKNGLTKTPGWSRELARRCKDQIKREFRRVTNKYPFVVGLDDQEFLFAFGWSLKDFCVNNSLGSEQASTLPFRQIKEKATIWREWVEKRLINAEFRKTDTFDVEKKENVTNFTIGFSLCDITHFFKFANDFQIEEEFHPK